MFILMFIITFLTIALIFSSRTIFNNYIINSSIYLSYKKINKHNNLTRIICSIVCLGLVIMYLAFRWVPAIINIVDYSLFSAPITEYRSANLSIFFMLDLCSILGILMPLLVIFDWRRQILLKPIAVLSILGGMATILFTTADLYPNWDAKLFFLGADYAGSNNGDEPLMFLMHYWMICIGFTVLAKTNKYSTRDILIIIGFIVIYCIYILVISKSLDIKTHVTALEYGDYFPLNQNYYDHQWAINNYPHPSYAIFVDIFSTKYAWVGSIASWTTFGTIVILIIIAKNWTWQFYTKRNEAKYENQQFTI